MKAFFQRWRKPSVVALVSGSILLLSWGVWYSRTDLSQAAALYDANRKAAMAQGMLMSLKEVEHEFDVPESKNAAFALQSLPSVNPPYDGYLDQLDAISQLPYLRFKRDLVHPNNPSIYTFAKVKDAVTPLKDYCRTAVRQNKPDQAARLLKTWSRIAILSADEGSLYAALIRLSFENQIESVLGSILEEHGNDPAWQDVVEKTLQSLEKPLNVRKVLQVEHGKAAFFVGWYLDHPQELEAHTETIGGLTMTVGYSPLPREIRFGKFIPNLKQANLARIHGVFAEAAAKLPPEFDHIDALKTAFAPFDAIGSQKGLSYILVSEGVMSTLIDSLNWSIGRRNAIAQALAILSRHRNPVQGLPLSGKYASDLDGKPIRLKHVAARWLVYSINHQKIDNKGDRTKGDFVITLPEPSK